MGCDTLENIKGQLNKHTSLTQIRGKREAGDTVRNKRNLPSAQPLSESSI